MMERDSARSKFKHGDPDIRGNIGRGSDDDRDGAGVDQQPAAGDSPSEPHARREQQIDSERLKQEPGIGP